MSEDIHINKINNLQMENTIKNKLGLRYYYENNNHLINDNK